MFYFTGFRPSVATAPVYQFLDLQDVTEKRTRIEEINTIVRTKRQVIEYLCRHSTYPRDPATNETIRNISNQISQLEKEKQTLSVYLTLPL